MALVLFAFKSYLPDRASHRLCFAEAEEEARAKAATVGKTRGAQAAAKEAASKAGSAKVGALESWGSP